MVDKRTEKNNLTKNPSHNDIQKNEQGTRKLNISWIGNLSSKTLKWTRTTMATNYFPVRVCGARIEEVNGHNAICSMSVNSKLYNSLSEMMGGAVYTLGDFATAAADLMPGMTDTTIDGHIQYLAPTKGKTLFAHVICKHYGYSIAYYDVDFITDENRLVAHGSYTYYHIHPTK